MRVRRKGGFSLDMQTVDAERMLIISTDDLYKFNLNTRLRPNEKPNDKEEFSKFVVSRNTGTIKRVEMYMTNLKASFFKNNTTLTKFYALHGPTLKGGDSNRLFIIIIMDKKIIANTINDSIKTPEDYKKYKDLYTHSDYAQEFLTSSMSGVVIMDKLNIF